MRTMLPLLMIALSLPTAALAQDRLVAPDARLRSVLATGDAQVLSTEDLDSKGRDPDRAQILVSSASRKIAVMATIDTASGRLIETRPVAQRDLPFTRQQLQQATTIALRNPAVRRGLGGNADRYVAGADGRRPPFFTQGFVVLSDDPADPCARERCVDLQFVDNGRLVAGRRVIVQLESARTTIQDLSARGEHHQ